MKHVISKEHHPHLKRRAIIELIGFVLLVLFIISEWELINTSLSAIRNSDLLFLIIALVIYWMLLPFTALSYRMLSYKKIPIITTSLAHLAGSGPGRIIPGGLGTLSMSAFHLKKLGLQTQKAIAVSLANNFIGVVLNVAVFLFVIFYRPDIRDSIFSTITSESLVFIGLLIMGVIVLCLWLYHFRKIRQTAKKTEKQLLLLMRLLLKKPRKLLGLFLIAFIILLGNVLMLQLSGDALGIAISPSDAVIALSIGVLIGGILPTPGGLGGVEAGIATSLALLGYGSQEAVSAALLYRTITYWQPLIPGTLAYLYLRERDLI